MRLKEMLEIFLLLVLIVLSYMFADFLYIAKQELCKSEIEYVYKDFTHKDIDAAMKYHGVNGCIIKEGEEPYFVDEDGREIILFTNSCIEYLYKQKQGGVECLTTQTPLTLPKN